MLDTISIILNLLRFDLWPKIWSILENVPWVQRRRCILLHLDQFSSVTQSCLTHCDTTNLRMPDLPVHHQLLESTQTHVHLLGDAIQPSHPLSFPSPPALNLSQHQGLLKRVSSSHQVAKVLEFQLQHHLSNEYSGLISFRMDRLDLFAVQGTLESLLQYHSSQASILQLSAFFMVQLSHPYWKKP